MNEMNHAEPTRKKRFGTPLLVAMVLLAEAAAFVGFMTLAGGPSTAEAGSALEIMPGDPDNAVIETLVLDARLQNNRSGVTYVFDTEIWVQVRAGHQEIVEREIARVHNEIRAEINSTWKACEPRELRESGLETVTRKIYALLSDRFGLDVETGEPVIIKCVIVAGTGFRADA